MNKHIDSDLLQNVEPSDIHIDTLAGDIRDHVLDLYKTMKTPWPLLAESKQRDLANGADLLARDMVRRVVRLVTAHDFPRVVVKVGDLKVAGGDKAGLEAKVTAANVTENREVLCKLPGRYAVLLCVDSDEFMGEREPVKVDPDQPELPTGDGAKSSNQKSQKDSDISDGADEAGDAEAPEEAEKPTEQGDDGGDLGYDPETGEVQEQDPDTPQESDAANAPASRRGESEWLQALAKLPEGGTSHVPEGYAAKLVEKGHIAVVSPKKGHNPARYTITPAGRLAANPEA